jgi:hypothetical protein
MLSSVETSSDWVILGCNTDSSQLQVVTAFCRKPEDDPTSGCSAVFEGGAKNTYVTNTALNAPADLQHSVVKMPSGCGGPYARLAHLEPNENLTLPQYHADIKPSGNPVYEMHFDYNFHLL